MLVDLRLKQLVTSIEGLKPDTLITKRPVFLIVVVHDRHILLPLQKKKKTHYIEKRCVTFEQCYIAPI